MSYKESKTWSEDSEGAEESRTPNGSPVKSSFKSFSFTTPSKLASIDEQLKTWLRVYKSESIFRQKFWQCLATFEKTLPENTSSSVLKTPRVKLTDTRRDQLKILKGVYANGRLEFSTIDDVRVVFYDDRYLVKAISKLKKGQLIEKTKTSPFNKSTTPTYGRELNKLVEGLVELLPQKDSQVTIPSKTRRLMESSLLAPKAKKDGQKASEDTAFFKDEVKRLVENIKDLERDLQATKNAMMHAVYQNSKCRHEHHEEKISLEQQRDKAIKRGKDLGSTLARKESEVDELQKIIAELKSKRRTLERKLTVKEAGEEERLDILNSEVQKVRDRYSRLIEKAQKDYEKKLDTYKKTTEAKLKEKNAALKKKLDKAQNRDESEELRALKEMLKAEKRRNEKLVKENTALQREVEVLGEILDGDNVEKIQQLEEEVCRLKDESSEKAEGAGSKNSKARKRLFIEDVNKKEGDDSSELSIELSSL